ncbi:MAG: hypothetical protein WCX47_00030 [Bacilli bacterium]|jgi:hypothetical protein|nr:hypothetical protein [Bacilli bacterium]MDD3388909.1 hypothetical protein [Bacilli bacterium]MDD4344637.1 hypothetical protein [Bacilli bacterium]MDD4520589.1 hypothetical protein [Bacilli bacterium]MDY0399281.1 hypothetical protein [Bacilli bacterium]
MTASITIVGTLGPKIDELTREVHVRRFYEAELKEQHLDVFRAVNWNHRPNAILYQAKEETPVAIIGRLENDDQGFPIIIVEQLSFLNSIH